VLTTDKWTQIQNVKLYPFEQTAGTDQKTALSMGGSYASPSTAYIHHRTILRIGDGIVLCRTGAQVNR
jgi:hypothetical protein